MLQCVLGTYFGPGISIPSIFPNPVPAPEVIVLETSTNSEDSSSTTSSSSSSSSHSDSDGLEEEENDAWYYYVYVSFYNFTGFVLMIDWFTRNLWLGTQTNLSNSYIIPIFVSL